jgi:hypothetical protein
MGKRSVLTAHWPTAQIPRCPVRNPKDYRHWSAKEKRQLHEWALSLKDYGPPSRAQEKAFRDAQTKTPSLQPTGNNRGSVR